MSQKKSIARLRFATMKPAVTLCHSRVAKVLTFATGAVLIAFKSRLFLVLLQLVIGVGDEELKWLNGLIRLLQMRDALQKLVRKPVGQLPDRFLAGRSGDVIVVDEVHSHAVQFENVGANLVIAIAHLVNRINGAKQHGGVETVPQLFQHLPVNDAERGFDGSAGFLRFRLRHGCVAPLW